MSALSIRKLALTVIACVLWVLLLALPAYAMPWGMTETTAHDTVRTTDPSPIGDGMEDIGEAKARGNLGDTDGDGVIEGNHTTTPEQDPMHAAENMVSQSGGWIAAAFCIAAVVTLLILIVVLIPKKRI